MKRTTAISIRKHYPIFESPEAHDDDEVLLNTMGAMALTEQATVAIKESSGKRRYVSGSRESEFISGLLKLARALVSSREEVCEVVSFGHAPMLTYRIKPKGLGFDLLWAFTDRQWHAQLEYPVHQFAPPVKTFLKIGQAASPIVRLFDVPYSDAAQVVQPMATILRSVRKLKFILRLALNRQKTFSRNPRKNYRNMIEGIEDAAQCSPWLGSGRIDLFLNKKEQRFKPNHKRPTIKELRLFQMHRRQFIRHVQNRFKGDLLRLFVKMEYGRDRLFHLHCLILLNGRIYKDMVRLMEELGQQWERMTGYTESFTNVHTLDRKLTYNAIGLVNVRERNVQIGFQKIASYFTLADVFVKLDLDDGDPETFAIFCPELTPKPGAYRPQLRMSFKEAVDTITYM